MKSYRKERMAQLRADLRIKHKVAGDFVVRAFIRPETPLGTPATTKKADYPVTAQLRNSITASPGDDHVDIGSSLYYAPYVHQGTYDWAHGHRGWNEPDALMVSQMFFHNDEDVMGVKGAMPRPFLVTGLIKSKPFLKPIYGKQIS